jgi:chromosome segregation ATPase
MSEITESKTSIKKILLLVEEIENLNTQNIPKLKEKPNEILNSIESLGIERNEILNTIEANNKSITSLKEKISRNNRDVAKLKEDLDDFTIKKTDLEKQIQKSQTDLKQLSEELTATQQEYEAKNDQLKNLEQEIENLRIEYEKFQEKINSLEEELEAKFIKRKTFVDSYENRIKAMKLLIEKDYIHTPQYQLINSLQKGAALDLKNILIAKDIREDLALKYINEMIEEDGPIEYDKDSGKITLLKEVDFK